MRNLPRAVLAGVVAALIPMEAAGAANGDISLLAGGGGAGHGGDGGPAIAAQLTFPEDCEAGPGGVVYVAEDARIRRIGSDGVIQTFAGGGPVGAAGEGGPATEADLRPAAIAVDAAGVVYVADAGRPRVVAISPDGTLRRVAGTGALGYSGDGGPASDASIGQPLSLALTRDAVYFTDAQTTAVRRVDLATRVIETVPQLTGAYEIAAGPDGSIYASMLAPGSTMGFGNRIVRLTPDGQVRPVAGTGATGFSGDGGPATSATFDRPLALAVDAAGSVFVSDAGNHRIRRIGPDGVISTIVGTGAEGLGGDGGPATAASIVFPRGLGVDVDGGLCIADTGGGVVRLVSAAAAPTPLPVTGAGFQLLAVAGTLLAMGSVLLAARQRPVGSPSPRSGNLRRIDVVRAGGARTTFRPAITHPAHEQESHA